MTIDYSSIARVSVDVDLSMGLRSKRDAVVTLARIGELLEEVQILRGILGAYMIREEVEGLEAGDASVKLSKGRTVYDYESVVNRAYAEAEGGERDEIQMTIDRFTEIPDPVVAWAKVTKALKLDPEVAQEPVHSLRFVYDGQEFGRVNLPKPKDRPFVIEDKEDRDDGIPF